MAGVLVTLDIADLVMLFLRWAVLLETVAKKLMFTVDCSWEAQGWSSCVLT